MINISKNLGSVKLLKKVKYFMVECRRPVYNLRRKLYLRKTLKFKLLVFIF